MFTLLGTPELCPNCDRNYYSGTTCSCGYNGQAPRLDTGIPGIDNSDPCPCGEDVSDWSGVNPLYVLDPNELGLSVNTETIGSEVIPHPGNKKPQKNELKEPMALYEGKVDLTSSISEKQGKTFALFMLLAVGLILGLSLKLQ